MNRNVLGRPEMPHNSIIKWCRFLTPQMVRVRFGLCALRWPIRLWGMPALVRCPLAKPWALLPIIKQTVVHMGLRMARVDLQLICITDMAILVPDAHSTTEILINMYDRATCFLPASCQIWAGVSGPIVRHNKVRILCFLFWKSNGMDRMMPTPQ